MSESIKMEIVNIPTSIIFYDDTFNCRGTIAPIDVVDLARSIDTNGLQQAISVQPYNKMPGKEYRVVLGHRRFQAFLLLQKENPEKYNKIPCTIQKNLQENEARVLNLIENLSRKDLNVMQEARAIEPFLRAGWTYQKVAEKLSQSTGWVQVRVTALRLEPEIQEQIAKGMMTQQQIKDVCAIASKEKRFNVVKQIIEAKERGEKKIVIQDDEDKKKDYETAKARSRAENFTMMETIQQRIGSNFGTRCLAFATGGISPKELEEDIAQIEQWINDGVLEKGRC